MLRRAAPFVLAALLLPAAAPAADPFEAMGVARADPPAPAPAFRAPLLGGGEADLAAYRGRVVLLNFWATWCAPCKDEMPHLEALWRRYGAEGLVLLAVSEDRGRTGRVERFVGRLGLTCPVPLDPDARLGRAYGVFGLPETVLIGRDGNLVGRIVGFRDWSGAPAARLVEQLLAEGAE